MQLPEFKANYSLGILAKIFLALAALGVGIYFRWDFIHNLYLQNQITEAGIIVNALTIILFFLGLLGLIRTLLRYHAEERAIHDFLSNWRVNPQRPLVGIKIQRLIADRYFALDNLHKQNAHIDSGALASVMLARESHRLTGTRFIHNILILSGVFGTVISLSIALLGASNLLGSIDDANGMNQVIHGMSTALSTTMTAIICYVFIGYFYVRTTDSQSRVLAMVEKISCEILVPKFSPTSERVNQHLEHLISALLEASNSVQTLHQHNDGGQAQLSNAIQEHNGQMVEMMAYLDTILRTLHHGFRLPSDRN